MPTGATSDLLPLRKETKRRLSRLKGDDATYDEVLRALLDAAPEAEVLAKLRGSAPRKEPRERPPEKQLLIASLAERRWAEWLAEGRVRPLGPRLYTWREAPRVDREVRYAVVGRRGLSP